MFWFLGYISIGFLFGFFFHRALRNERPSILKTDIEEANTLACLSIPLWPFILVAEMVRFGPVSFWLYAAGKRTGPIQKKK